MIKLLKSEDQALKFSSSLYPSITPIPQEVERPLWSVMIPTYNGTKYLEQTLRSVLEQDLGISQMQIEVIDDCSTKDDPESLVKEIGRGRVSFFRQPRNVGLVNNWNACIQRSRGYWVHILHQDDIVLPGFYNQLLAATQASPAVGAAFCRHAYIDGDEHWQGLSEIESRTSGILVNWIERIAVAQRIQFPAMVVKRCVYEELGGFLSKVHFAADWEMWKRIASHYQIWYEPRILACYRMHNYSETSRLAKSGSDIVDIRKAIEIAEAYLPQDKAHFLSLKAKEHFAFHALSTARRMLSQNELIGAANQIQEAFRCSRSFKVFQSSLPLIRSLVKRSILYKSRQLWNQL
ncbi:glycosyltransferase [Leptolyngbya sp. NK1-12]|uniref:Glycosyltransferase n=1 Tax=Leptolyngbya sp. NK1-12 TaxID=2547451 RepID=A0AA96WYW0_9CYAN|nr:glycosyltransferase [Leptolyngbya sp. NK1-12]